MHRHRILGKGLFCTEIGCPNAHIDEFSNTVNHRNEEDQTGTVYLVELAQPQDQDLVPVIDQLE